MRTDNEKIIMQPTVYGVGINDIKWGPRSPAYTAWKSMLKRAYSPAFHAKHPSYRGVNVAPEWHKLSAFSAWYEVNHIKGYHLDKDLLSNRKEYSPNTCLFIPPWLNNLLLDGGAIRGNLPQGVFLERNMIRACCRISGKTHHLGTFDTVEKASFTYLGFKEGFIRARWEEISAISPNLGRIVLDRFREQHRRDWLAYEQRQQSI